MIRQRFATYLQLTVPFLVAVACAVWMRRQGQPLPTSETPLALLLLSTVFATLVSVNLDRPLPRIALTGMNLAALVFFYAGMAHPLLLAVVF